MAPSGLILHHFEQSPFSEKIRLILGFKKLAWQSCLVPRILPKPDLMPLTGGYRRTPVLQIGADIFCDTQMIVRAIEWRHPQPPLIPPALGGIAGVTPLSLAMWSDRPFFQTTVSLVFGTLGDTVPAAFVEDRTKMRGAPFDLAAMQTAMPQLEDQYRAHCDLIEQQLADGRDFLHGAASLADIDAYMCVWYVRAHLNDAARLFAPFPRLQAWEARVKAIGHGRRTDIAAEEALDIARDARPSAADEGLAADPSGRRPGDRVTVAPDDYGKDPVAGTIVSLSAQHIAIRRSDPRVGEINVWFPRIGFAVRAI